MLPIMPSFFSPLPLFLSIVTFHCIPSITLHSPFPFPSPVAYQCLPSFPSPITHYFPSTFITNTLPPSFTITLSLSLNTSLHPSSLLTFTHYHSLYHTFTYLCYLPSTSINIALHCITPSVMTRYLPSTPITMFFHSLPFTVSHRHLSLITSLHPPLLPPLSHFTESHTRTVHHQFIRYLYFLPVFNMYPVNNKVHK